MFKRDDENIRIGCQTVVTEEGDGKFSLEVVIKTQWGEVRLVGPMAVEHFFREFSAARDEYYTMRERIKQVERTQQEKDNDA